MVGPSRKPLKRTSAEAAAAEAAEVDVDGGDDVGAGGDDDYKNKRARNNDAVKRSRAKAKAKVCETSERVSNLKAENEDLEGKIKILSKELQLLKDMFVAHAGREPFKSRLRDFLGIKGIPADSCRQEAQAPYDDAAAKKILTSLLAEN